VSGGVCGKCRKGESTAPLSDQRMCNERRWGLLRLVLLWVGPRPLALASCPCLPLSVCAVPLKTEIDPTPTLTPTLKL